MKMRFIRRYILFFASISIALGGCEEVGVSTESDDGVVAEFKMSESESDIILPVTIDGSSYNFILDTGCGATIFGKNARQSLGTKVRTQKLHTIRGINFEAEVYKSPTEFMIDSLPVLVDEVLYIDDFKKYDMGDNCDGIIGMDVLKDYVIKLDFIGSRVQFIRSGYKSMDSNHEVSMGNKPNYENVVMPYVPSKVMGHKVDFLIDTGFPHPYVGYLQDSIFEKILKESACETQEAIVDDQAEQSIVARISFDNMDVGPVFLLKRHTSVVGIKFLRVFDSVTFYFPEKKVGFRYSKFNVVESNKDTMTKELETPGESKVLHPESNMKGETNE